ncbi:tyrosine-type recombinase/integrase [Vibrio sp. S9_S30]|uniref:tyrosine-type recombinase/integrase n=1 Tax=Vibrio sp. S9_S30 TaxID=2720226 RepID=UPI00168097C7|nr:tyrosine-type recombinase/integrase [Vibrio sp. S9_S30]MBD1558665.1 tyrosine-type recombinase/integrase [Vibrio sp. S9_S30]
MKKNITPITDLSIRAASIKLFSRSVNLEELDKITDGQYSVNSLKSMVNDWNNFVSFCAENGVASLPASVTAVKRFIEKESSKKKFASIRRCSLTIGTIHKIHSYSDPTNHRQVRFVLSALRLQKHGDNKSAHAFTSQYLLDLHILLSSSILAKDIRDLAIYSIMFECALKRSELRKLNVENIAFKNNLAVIHLGDKAYELSANSSRALSKWIEINHTNVLFCRIDKHENLYESTLDDSSIYRIFRRGSTLLGLSGDDHFSGQSSRIGAVTELASQGYKLKEIQDFGRWLSPAMPAQYLGKVGTADKEKLKFVTIKPWD